MEDQIREIVRASTEPLTALEIAKKIGGKADKKSVNSCLYKMTDMELVPESKPPRWRIKDTSTSPSHPSPSLPSPSSKGATPIVSTTGSSSGGTSDDSDLKEQLIKLLTTEPQSTPDLQRQLNDTSIQMQKVKNTLYKNPDIATNVAPKNSKPLWVKAGMKKELGGASMPSTLDGKQLYTRDDSEKGKIIFKEVTSEDLTTKDDEVKNTPTPPSLDQTVASLTLNEEIDESQLKEKILTYMRSHPDMCFTSVYLATALGQPTRDKTLDCLMQLEKEKLVEVTNDDKYKILPSTD